MYAIEYVHDILRNIHLRIYDKSIQKDSRQSMSPFNFMIVEHTDPTEYQRIRVLEKATNYTSNYPDLLLL